MTVATTESCPNEFTRFIVPAMTWAKIQMKVPWSREKWKYIYGEWFPSSGYEQIEGLKIQVGPEVQIGVEKQIMTEEVDVELWLPVAKIK
ncbi:GyrI-like domain-containing protein [Bacillus sp. SD088]|uniref:GyrI-like domain-containing protein n=1 Tax=Bacillus sp. SD088 TaxID=2782012 RepID=UPI001A977608|nr:effector binding domain-containing protein [Bacillus sp. SD088]MBO0995050.1 GyrI-like domain-containing protein [Bacillus sp. SD088]